MKTGVMIGAFFLSGVDAVLERQGLFFRRYMDDVLVLAPTRWKLRRAVKALNQALGGLELDKHPDKTFIGRAEKGFDFLGYRLAPSSFTVCEAVVRTFADRKSVV